MEGDLLPLSSATAEPHGRDEIPVELTAALEAAEQVLGQRGLTVDAVVRRGQPAAAIVDEAAALDAELVVVGSRGLGWARSMLLGSVAAGVVDGTSCPVLVTRSPSLHNVLLAVDETAPSAAAIEVVARWPIFEATRISVLSVATAVPQYGDVPGGMHELVETTRQQRVADAAATTLRRSSRRAIARVRTGDAAARILAVAEGESVDLIVLGSRGRTGLRRALLGSVGREVLSSAKTSVLVVRTADR
jgi:nucleotide-binding universal stress UspA family protein